MFQKSDIQTDESSDAKAEEYVLGDGRYWLVHAQVGTKTSRMWTTRV